MFVLLAVFDGVVGERGMGWWVGVNADSESKQRIGHIVWHREGDEAFGSIMVDVNAEVFGTGGVYSGSFGGVWGHLRSSVGLISFFLHLGSDGAGARWVVGVGSQ